MNWAGFGFLVVALFNAGSDAFTSSRRGAAFHVGKPLLQPTTTDFRTKPIYFFGRNNNDSDKENDSKSNSNAEAGEDEKKGPFFARLLKKRVEESPTSATVAEDSVASGGVSKATLLTRPKEPEDAASRAKSFRAQAERARLEADRMDAELTLSKIERLERQLKVAKNKGESIEELQRQLDNLQAKLRGEPPCPVLVKETKPKPDEKEAQPDEKEPDITADPTWMSMDLEYFMGKGDFEETRSAIESAPKFIKRVLAILLEVEFDTVTELNTTEVAARTMMVKAGDFSFINQPKPVFTESQIENTLSQLENDEVSCPARIVEDAAGDKRKLAEYILEMEYYIERKLENKDFVDAVLVGDSDELLQDLIEAFNTTSIDLFLSLQYPKCTRKEDGQEPTMAQMQSFATNVLPKVKFQASSKPEKVVGGYIINGSYKFDKGDDLIEAIDIELAKAGLADKMTVILSDDFSEVSKAAENEEQLEWYLSSESTGPLLYILGPDVVRESKPVQLSIVSALGLATSWYLSIYPFLLNPTLGKRVEEQLAVADAGMTYDLEWLTDLSLPLFFYFIGIQILHEVGHRITASAYDVELSAPTFVPSLVTGITSSVTSFKSLPKNKDALFDISFAGPFMGVLASLAALFVGSQLTLTSDPGTLPSLPVDILRQSTLGGSIIDTIIPGALYVPDGAPSSGLMVSLHPLAVAGYISLVVNSLALLPVGTTDGGRIAMTLFGRSLKPVIGYITMVAILFTGIFGSDLFLFYFAFVIAFQTGNEVPARNELDDINGFRVAAGGLAFATAFLALVPFQ